MILLLQTFGILFGALLIFILAEVILRKTLDLGDHWGWTGSFLGLTVLSIGTSLPEILTHIIASIDILKDPSTFNTLSALVVGTNIGSDIFQQNLILPLVGIVGSIIILKKNLLKEMGGLIFASALLWVFSWSGLITRFEGILLVLTYLAYLIYLKNGEKSKKKIAKNHLSRYKLFSSMILILISFILVSVATEFILNLSEQIVASTGISASFFGVLILGVIAALPELSTSLVAVIKNKKEISAGVLIGSNITNPLFALGLGAMISSYSVPNVVLIYDLPIKIVTAGLLYIFLFKNETLRKREAIFMIVLFFIYLVLRQYLFPIDFIASI